MQRKTLKIIITLITSQWLIQSAQTSITADQVKQVASTIGKISILYSNHRREQGHVKLAETAHLVAGISFLAQAFLLYRLKKAYYEEKRPIQETHEPTTQTYSSPLITVYNASFAAQLIKAIAGSYYHTRTTSLTQTLSYNKQKWWNLALALLTIAIKTLDLYSIKYHRSMPATSYAIASQTSLHIRHQSPIGLLFEKGSAFLEFLETSTYFSRYLDYRILSSPSLIQVIRKTTLPTKGICTACQETSPLKKMQQPTYAYCKGINSTCAYHEDCLKQMITSGQHACPTCGQMFAWRPISDIFASLVNTFSILLLPIYLIVS